MTTEHFQVRAGMEVLDADRAPVGQVTEVRASDFVVERPQLGPSAVPFAAIGDVLGAQIVLTVTAAHLETLKWPQQDEPAADSDSTGPIAL